MKSYLSRAYVLLITSFVILSGSVFGQEGAIRSELESVLRQFKNYRFGDISVWELSSTSEINRVFKQKEQQASGVKIDPACVKTADPKLARIVEDGVVNGDQQETILDAISGAGLRTPTADEFECLFQFFKAKHSGGSQQNIEKGYLITTRPEKGRLPDTIIALIISYSNKSLEKNLRSVTPQYILTINELKAFKLDTGFSANNLYDLMMNSFVQAAVENKTLEAQGLGTLIRYAPPVYGKSKSMVLNEANVQSDDIQQFLRVSDGQPFDYVLKNHEIILSPDLISWKEYPTAGDYDNSGNFVTDSIYGSNGTLPTLGLEMRYGIEDFHYPSFWSERVTVSAVWQNVKLGVILPTDGWSSLGKDLFNEERTLTYGGIGIAGMFDFPIKVIPQSGVFHFSFGYVFGDAAESAYKNRNLTVLNYQYDPDNNFYNDYLIRGNAQLHYTFALKVDNDYMFRFGIGASGYNVEKWYNELIPALPPDTKAHFQFVKANDETIFGLSGRIEFMARNIATPYGASVEYFDESLSGCIWLDIPIVPNTLALRLDAKGYFAAFKNDLHPWESKSIFVPMARLIISF